MRGDRGRTANLFVGREAELSRIAAAMPKVRCALLLGLEGVGKSAVAGAFAQLWPGRVLYPRVAASASGEALLDALTGPGQSSAAATVGDDERVTDLAQRLDGDHTLVVLDDADRLDGHGRALLADLVDRIERARVVATARAHVFGRGEGPDRLQLTVNGLDRDAAHQLWTQLDELYGARDGFEDAWQRSCGNPLYLRRAHAGHGGGGQLLDTVDRLRCDDRAVAIALAVSGCALGADVVARLLPEPRGRAAIEHLIECLVAAELDGGQVALHEPVRAPLLRTATAAERQDAHRRLAGALAGASGEPATAIRERFGHLVASRQHSAARSLILDSAGHLLRLGASCTLRDCLDAMISDGDVAVRLARARVRARMLELRPAFDELAELRPNGTAIDDQVRASYAQVALLTGRFELAERLSREALASRTLDGALRVRHASTWLLTRTFQGRGEAARRGIAALTGDCDRAGRSHVTLAMALSFWLDQRDSDAEEAMRAAWSTLAGDRGPRAHALGAALWVAVLARSGKIEEATGTLRIAEGAAPRGGDRVLEVALGAVRMILLESRGELRAALIEATRIEREWSDAGHAMAASWARLRRGELLLRLGRAREGRCALDELARDAAVAGAELIVRQAAQAHAADPRRAVVDPPAAPVRPGERRRERVLAVLRAVAADRAALARGHLAALSEDRTLEPLERALLMLAEAALARSGSADGIVARASELACRAGADPEVIGDLDRWLREARERAQSVRPIVIDRARHTIRVNGALIELASRPALRRLLYALLGAASRDKPSLAAALWAGEYRPARHDGALWVNIKRLRDLLRATGLRVVTDAVGYRLEVDDGYRLVLSPP